MILQENRKCKACFSHGDSLQTSPVSLRLQEQHHRSNVRFQKKKIKALWEIGGFGHQNRGGNLCGLCVSQPQGLLGLLPQTARRPSWSAGGWAWQAHMKAGTLCLDPRLSLPVRTHLREPSAPSSPHQKKKQALKGLRQVSGFGVTPQGYSLCLGEEDGSVQ